MSARDRLCSWILAGDPDALLDAYRDEVLAEAKTEVVAWLVKKATEQRMWDAGVLASKVDRGAVRAFLGTGHYRDAMDAHRAEVLRETAGFMDAHCEQYGVLGVGDKILSLIGKDTGGATQAPAGESTQPAPDLDDDQVMSAARTAIADFPFAMYGIDIDGPDPAWVGDLASAITGALGTPAAPAAEYAHWTAITTALNTAAAAGIHIGIDVNGDALTDLSDRAITYDSTEARWVVVCNDCDRTLQTCGHCPHCDTCDDCAECSGTGCTCRCEVPRG
jgi:hypothetical protein